MRHSIHHTLSFTGGNNNLDIADIASLSVDEILDLYPYVTQKIASSEGQGYSVLAGMHNMMRAAMCSASTF